MVRCVNSNKETLREYGRLDISYQPFTYQLGTFTLSQINWNTLVKEVYAIMMSFCKMAFYLHGAEVVIQSDHAPLQKLIKNKTKMNWHKIEALGIFSISPHITFQHRKGKDNILADSLSHLQHHCCMRRVPQKNLVKNMALQYLMKVKPFMNMHNQRLHTSKSRYGNTCYWLPQWRVCKW